MSTHQRGGIHARKHFEKILCRKQIDIVCDPLKNKNIEEVLCCEDPSSD